MKTFTSENCNTILSSFLQNKEICHSRMFNIHVSVIIFFLQFTSSLLEFVLMPIHLSLFVLKINRLLFIKVKANTMEMESMFGSQCSLIIYIFFVSLIIGPIKLIEIDQECQLVRPPFLRRHFLSLLLTNILLMIDDLRRK